MDFRTPNIAIFSQRTGEIMEQTRLETLRSRLAEYRNAETAILDGAQSYKIGSRQLDRAQLYKVAEMIEYLEREIASEKRKVSGRGRIRTFGVVPRDL
jgi:hypothetical protein